MKSNRVRTVPVRTVIFDLDGTLIDSEKAALGIVRACLSEWGCDPGALDEPSLVGLKWESAVARIHEQVPGLPHAAEASLEEFIRRYRKHQSHSLVEIPGAARAVREISREFDVGLVSGSYRGEIFSALERLGIRECFRIVLGAEDYPLSKPAPDGFLRALRELGADPSATLVFEDSEAGIESALAAGARVAAVGAANHFGHDHSRAHHRVGDLTGIDADWVRRLTS